MEELAIRLIAETPATMRRLTKDLTPDQTHSRPAEGEWSIVELAGHLVDKTEAWGERFRRIASEDGPRLEAFDQDARVRERSYQSQQLDDLAPRLDAMIGNLVRDLRALPDDAWERSGTHTERGIITLSEGVRLYAISLPQHMDQLIRTRDAALREPSLSQH
jgi:hypothetical protein